MQMVDGVKVLTRTGVLAAACGLAASAAANPVQLTKVALSGEAAPGLADATFTGFSDLRLNDSGLALLWAEYEGPGFEEGNNGGLFVLDAGPLGTRLLEGGDAPWRIVPATFTAVPRPALSEPGAVALVGAVDELGIPLPGEEARNIGVFRQEPGADVEVLAQKGAQALGLDAGVLYRNPSDSAISSNGLAAFSASTWLDDGSDAETVGVWSDRSGGLELVASTGDVVAGPFGDETLEHLDPPAINHAGSIVLRASLQSSPPGDDQPVFALLVDASGVQDVVMQTGQAAPGLGDATFGAIGRRPLINNAGDVLVWASVNEGGAASGSVWVRRAGSLELVTREGDTAPGAGGATFERLSRTPSLNAASEVAFWATIRHGDGSAGYGIWSDSIDGELSAVAVSGEQVFGLEPGTEFEHVEEPMIDASGQVLFVSRLAGPAVGPENDRALFVRDTAGRLGLVLREGDDVDVHGDGSDIRTLAEVVFEAGQPLMGLGQANGSRQALVQLRFDDDSSGVFMATIAAPADLDGDGIVGINDFFLFLDEFANQAPLGDFNQDGVHDVADVFAFLDSFASG